MRLNFSGVNEDEIREGIRRLGEVIREQVALYCTLDRPAAPSAVPPGEVRAGPASRPRRRPRQHPDNVLPLSRKRAG